MNKTVIGIAAIIVPILFSLLKIFHIPHIGLISVLCCFSLMGLMVFLYLSDGRRHPNSTWFKYASECENADFDTEDKNLNFGYPIGSKNFLANPDVVLIMGVVLLDAFVISKSQYWKLTTDLRPCVAVLFCIVFLLLYLNKKANDYAATRDIKKIAFVGLLATGLVSWPNFWNFIEVNRYKDYPHYVECVKQAAADPTPENEERAILEHLKVAYLDSLYNNFAEREAKANELAKQTPNSIVVYSTSLYGVFDWPYAYSIEDGDLVSMEEFLGDHVEDDDPLIEDNAVRDSTHIYLVTDNSSEKNNIESILRKKHINGVVVEEIR